MAGPGTVTHPFDKNSFKHVGGVIPTLKIRLRDCVELGYLSTDNPPRGEIQFKGVNTFSGYFKNPERTKEALTEDGWVNTGDVGLIFPNGAIKVIDRAKNIFKLSQGEYIAPEKLENIYGQIPKIAQIFVYGDSLKHFLVAVVVPDPIHLKAFADSQGISVAEALNSKDYKNAILHEMDLKVKEHSLTSLEKIKAVHLSGEAFSVENNIVTPTLKLKRNIAKAHFKEALDQMYAET